MTCPASSGWASRSGTRKSGAGDRAIAPEAPEPPDVRAFYPAPGLIYDAAVTDVIASEPGASAGEPSGPGPGPGAVSAADQMAVVRTTVPCPVPPIRRAG
jgi:hypothetical protein